MASYANIKRENVLDAIRDSFGITLTVAKRLGCTWETARRLINKWEETRQAFENEGEIMLDLAERGIVKAVAEQDLPTCKWVLATKGRARGYESIPTVKVDDSDPLNINFTRSNLTAQDLKAADNIEIGGDDDLK